MVQNFKNVDFLSFTETYLTTEDSTLTYVRECHFVIRNTSTRKGGGVPTYDADHISRL